MSGTICLNNSKNSPISDVESIRTWRPINKNHGDADDNFDFPPVQIDSSGDKDIDIDVLEKAGKSHSKSTGKCSKSPKRGTLNESLHSTSKSRAKKKCNTKSVDNEKIWVKKNTARGRIMKKIIMKQQKNIQPGECMKFIQVDMDQGIKNFDFYQETLTMLDCSSVSYSVNSLLIPNSLVWTRVIEEDSINDDNEVNTAIMKECQKPLVIIWSWAEVVKQIFDKSFTVTVASIAASTPQMKLSLIIYGIEGYFDYHKRKIKKNANKIYEGIDNMPEISRKDFESSLMDIQLGINCNSRLIEKSADMSLLIYQYTKAIAEIPYKLEAKNRLHDQMDFYAVGDNKNTIKVDNEGYGSKKLWLKQLCMFNSSGLATAEAICSIYSSPDGLMNAYLNCSVGEGEKLLKDIPVKRAAGPLSTVRKLGPELSRKIYIMFTSTDGEQLLY